MQAMTLSTLPDIEGVTADGQSASLYDFVKSDRLTLAWWHPQILSPASCKSCSGDAEPIKLLTGIYEAGCDVIGLTFESPDRAMGYLRGIGLEYPILSVGKGEAGQHGVVKVEGEEWPSLPRRVAFLVQGDGTIINRYEVHEPVAFLRQVRDDVKAGPPTSKWERRGWFARMLGR